MFALVLAILASAPAAVSATGMEPQIRLIRLEAAKRGWPITCLGHSGEEGVIKVGVPPGTQRKAVDSFMQTLSVVASAWGNVGKDASKSTCDEEPRVTGDPSNPAFRTLIFLTQDQGDARLLSVAHDCGFTRAYWRATVPEDFALYAGRLDAKKFPLTLDAGENAGARLGPLTCFGKLGTGPLFKHRR